MSNEYEIPKAEDVLARLEKIRGERARAFQKRCAEEIDKARSLPITILLSEFECESDVLPIVEPKLRAAGWVIREKAFGREPSIVIDRPNEVERRLAAMLEGPR